eukprot:scaffold10353_cov127-Isochrysis_galbana.AAC.10
MHSPCSSTVVSDRRLRSKCGCEGHAGSVHTRSRARSPEPVRRPRRSTYCPCGSLSASQSVDARCVASILCGPAAQRHRRATTV